MKVIFAHDHKFAYCDGLYYSNGSFPSTIWPRYTSVFQNLTVVGRDGGELDTEEKGLTLSSENNVSFRLLPNTSNLKSFVFGNRQVEDVCAELVAEHDALIARLPSRLGSMFVKEAKKQGKPYAVEVVGCPWDALWNYGSLKGKLYAPYAALEMKSTLRKSRYSIYVTKCFLQSRYPSSKGVSVGCSDVVISNVEYKVLEKRLEKIYNKKVDEPVVFGLIANYSSRYKGIDIAIKALKRLNLPGWQLRVLGNGDATYYANFATELGVVDQVDFVGSLPSGAPVFDWVDSIDIYLHPSFQEGLPRALVEAMSRGAPALASEIAGIPELLNESELIKAGDCSALASKIIRLINDKSLQATLAKQNFEKAKNYYKEELDKRRSAFWRQFLQHVKIK
jgi:glycosyltransferase involved in cell wall biosynthesis